MSLTKKINQNKVVELEKEIARLERLVYSDVLVNAYNRRGLLKFSQKLFEIAVQARSYTRRKNDKARELSLFLIDIDNFKHYNDTYSYALGDNILKKVSSYFNNHIRKTDVFGRWGGDEFILLLPFTNSEAARKLAENHLSNFSQTNLRLLKSKKQYIGKCKSGEIVTFSIGIASLNKEKTIQALISRANKGLKLAKKKKNAIVVAK